MASKIINKILGRRKEDEASLATLPSVPSPLSRSADEATKPLTPLPGMVTVEDQDNLEPPQLIVGCGQSVGIQRDHNEDALFCFSSVLASNSSNLPFGLFIVADGMGGHQHGEVASETAIRAMAEYVIRNLYLPLVNVNPTPPEKTLQEIMQAGVSHAHKLILRSVMGGGTTLTALLILGRQMVICHVGDSRMYALDLNGTIKALTRDHSLVKRLEELGQLTPEEAAIHPNRNVLYRALGQGEPFDPEIIISSIPAGGHLLVCSDGLWGVISEEEISQIVKKSPTPHQACKELVAAANAAGGPDNITAILVKLPMS